MTYTIKDCRPGCMCLDERSGRLFAASAAGMRELKFPECATVRKFGNIEHAYLTLSPDGKYLAAYNAVNQLRVYDTDHLDAPVFSKKWNVAAGGDIPCRFLPDGALVVAVQDYLIGITLEGEPRERVLYGDPKKKPNRRYWKSNGHITAFSTRGNEIAAIHKGFGDTPSHYLYSRDGGASFEKRESLLMDQQYPFVFLPPQGGVCLLSFTSCMDPMLYFKGDPGDFQSPDARVNLPCGLSSMFHFSDDGRYMAMQTIEIGAGSVPANRIDVYETQSWTKLREEKGDCFNSSFSSNGRYWLVPGRKAMIVDLQE